MYMAYHDVTRVSCESCLRKKKKKKKNLCGTVDFRIHRLQNNLTLRKGHALCMSFGIPFWNGRVIPLFRVIPRKLWKPFVPY